MKFDLVVNGKPVAVDTVPDMPLLWVLREKLQLMGTKFGCGAGQCGACTVHLGGQPARSCQVPIQSVQGASITTIEGLDENGAHALQKAWIALDVPQCGYCQSGMIMAAAALLAEKPHPSEADIEQSITNLCRCGTYERIRKAIAQAAGA